MTGEIRPSSGELALAIGCLRDPNGKGFDPETRTGESYFRGEIDIIGDPLLSWPNATPKPSPIEVSYDIPVNKDGIEYMYRFVIIDDETLPVDQRLHVDFGFFRYKAKIVEDGLTLEYYSGESCRGSFLVSEMSSETKQAIEECWKAIRESEETQDKSSISGLDLEEENVGESALPPPSNVQNGSFWENFKSHPFKTLFSLLPRQFFSWLGTILAGIKNKFLNLFQTKTKDN